MKRLFILLILFIALFSWGCGKPEKKEQRPVAFVDVVTVEKSSVGARKQVYSASIEPYSSVNLVFKGEGYVNYIHRVSSSGGGSHYIDPGDMISSGTVLASLRSGDYRNRLDGAQSQVEKARAGVKQVQAKIEQAGASVEMARAQEKEAKAAVEEAQAEVQAELAQLTRSELDFKRATNLYEKESMTKADYDAAREAYDVAKAQHNAAKAKKKEAFAAHNGARAQVIEAKKNVEILLAVLQEEKADVSGAQTNHNQAMLDYDDASLRSPMAGVVVARNIDIGTLAAPGVVAFVIAEIDTVKAVFGVPGFVVNSLSLGQAVTITFDSLPGRIYKGHIMTLSASADPKERTFKVEVRLNNPDKKLKLGMIASLELDTGEGAAIEAITIPLTALVRDPENPQKFSVYLVKGEGNSGTAHLRIIETGEAIGNNIVVRTGLSSGERVVSSGTNLIKDGDPVKIGE